MAIDAIPAIDTAATTSLVPVYDPLAAYAASKAYATSALVAPSTLTPNTIDPTRSFAPGPAIDDSAGSTVPRASDYNAQAALGLAFASPAVVTSLAPGAAAMAALASIPAVGPVEYLAPITRGAMIADPRFIDVYR
jgi:hypothetical protein